MRCRFTRRNASRLSSAPQTVTLCAALAACGPGSDAGPSPDGDPGAQALPSGVVTGVYRASIGYFDAVLDPERHQLFLSRGGEGAVEVVHLDDGRTERLTTGFGAEHLHFDPDRDEVLVSMATAAHWDEWEPDEQEGRMAVIDATTLADPQLFWLPRDPWQLVSDGTGNAYVMGASGPWLQASFATLDYGSSGWYSTTQVGFRRSTIRIHPDLDRIYGVSVGDPTGLQPWLPAGLVRWDIEDHTITTTRLVPEDLSACDDDSVPPDLRELCAEDPCADPSAGVTEECEATLCGELRIHPGGTVIHTRCGQVYLASNGQRDLSWAGKLPVIWRDLVFHPSGDVLFVIPQNPVAKESDVRLQETFTKEVSAVYAYDASSLSYLGATAPSTVGVARRLFTGPDYLVVLRDIAESAVVEVAVMPYPDFSDPETP